MKTFAAVVGLLLQLAFAVPLALAQDAVDRLDMKAHEAFDAQDYDTAIKYWSEELKLAPNNAAVRYNRASAYELKADPDDALVDCNEAIRLDPNDADAYGLRAQIFVEKAGILPGKSGYTENVEKAIADYGKMFEIQTHGMENAKAWLEKKARLGGGGVVQSLACWSTIIKLDPKDEQAYSGRAYTWNRVGYYEKAVADYTEAIRLHPQDDGPYYRRAEAFKMDCEYDKAIADCTEVLRLKSAGYSEVAYSLRAECYEHEKQYDKEIADLTEVVRLEPKFAGVYSSRGSAYCDNGEYDKALADFKQAIQLDPVTVYFLYGPLRVYKATGDKEKASEAVAKILAFYNAAVNKNPKDDNALANRAEFFAKMGENEKAIADYNEAIGLNSKYYGIFKGRGKLYLKMGDWDKAIQDLSEAIRQEPYEDCSIYYSRGLSYAGKQDYAKAMADIQHAVEMRPLLFVGIDALARIYATCPKAEFRDGAKAVELATKACEHVKWKASGFLATLAAAEAETGKFDDAVKHAEQALVQTKDGKDVDQKKLDEMTAALANYRQKKPYRDDGKWMLLDN